jgi:hypothetical protein
MEILERNCIAIDYWSVLFPEQTTFLLSHLHSDHATIPKKFEYPVYSSVVSGVLATDTAHKVLRPTLQPDCWYRTHQSHIPFKVLNTMHTTESIGFFFPSLSVLYMGDCMHSIIPHVPRPLTVIYDGLYEHIGHPLPTMALSCKLIRNVLQTQCPVLQAVHHGILSFISLFCGTRFRLHPSVTSLIQKTAHFLELVDENSPFLLVGRGYTGPCIIPSSYFFMRDTSIDPFSVYRNDKDNTFRVFCCLHARATDIATWKQTNPYACFEVLKTNSV